MYIPIFSRFIALESSLPKVISSLQRKSIVPIVDYCVENSNDNLHTVSKVMQTMNKTRNSFIALKLSSLSLQNPDVAYRNASLLCKKAINTNNKIMIDQEENKTYDVISEITDELIKKWNQNDTHVYKTYQMYRRNSFEHLYNDHIMFNRLGISHGIKLVRGAYWNKDANTGNLYTNINDTHINFDNGVDFLFNHGNINNVVFATHNAKSIDKITKNGIESGIKPNVATLLGMGCGSLKENDNVHQLKYVPYGPPLQTIPYLIRRLYENYSILKYII